jgi:superfamily II DNA or RNA helicase
MSFAVGSLVKAREREWVVLPDSTDDLLVLRPLGGTDDEVTGIYLPLERVEPARFDLPDPSQVGDFCSCRLLRDAVRLGFRSSAGPFRCFAQLAVEPRPYQLVPLLMALKLDPVRLLIADDVGIGKTVEACLIARELLDRGEARRLAILCPPHLAEQWQAELRSKFNIQAELLLPSTVTRLERDLNVGQSLFEFYPYLIVSTDLIKSDRRRDDFLRSCPELVMVDEAHTCALQEGTSSSRHLRNQLLRGLASDPDRHLILVTATPHSGKEEAFRSLLSLLKPEFAELPDDLTGPDRAPDRRRLAQHFVQRRRGDIRHYLSANTVFPERTETETTYKLAPEYKRLFDRVLAFARETVQDEHGGVRFRQRVRWWSALALLRSMASSPAAAAATLRCRAAVASAQTPEDADEIGQRTVLDLEEDDGAAPLDATPGGDPTEPDAQGEEQSLHRRLLSLAREADDLCGEHDAKLTKAAKLIKELVSEGHRPIVFCRFIPTAEYLARELRARLGKGVEVGAVTGTLPPSERKDRVLQLAESAKPVLVCTDCLSEGINLQEHFDAVVHYDLSWNPTRHEQREGRVDRFAQPRKVVRMVTYYGVDNQIDGLVLDVLIRRHKAIRSSLGVSVPVPASTNQVIEAVVEGLLLRGRTASTERQPLLPFPDFESQKEALFGEWQAAADRERRSRTMFAQETIKPQEVLPELQAVQSAIGSGADVARFIRDALRLHGGVVSERGDGPLRIDLAEVPRALRERIDAPGDVLAARFELPVAAGEEYLNRTHPAVEAVATHVMDTALDSRVRGVARRAGVIRTGQVARRTTLLLVRFRYHIITRRGEEETPLLAEDCQTLAFAGSPQNAEWLDDDQAAALVDVHPDGNVPPDQAADFVRRVIEGYDMIASHIDEVARRRGDDLLQAHRRVRHASRLKGISQRIEPKLPSDVLGIYVFMPRV